MDPTTLYHQAEAGDPHALATVRSLTARVRAGRASPHDRAAHADLVRLHARGGSAPATDIDDDTYRRLSTMMHQIAGRSLLPQTSIGAGHAGGGGGGHPSGGGGGGGGHWGGGGHGGFVRGGGGRGWGGGWGWGWPAYPYGYAADACYWDPIVERYVCWTALGWVYV
jgi:hypothetical protein